MRKNQFAIALTCMFPFLASSETWKLATLEWPPYTCNTVCPESGASGKALVTAMKAVGVDIQQIYYPWSRAIREASSENFVGYWVSWPEDCVEGFTFSEALHTSPFGLVEAKSKPLKIVRLSDLSAYRVGAVQDYGNTPEYNALVKNGTIKHELVVNDAQNMQKVAAGRLDIALIDTVNYEFYIKSELNLLKDKLQLNKMILEEKSLAYALEMPFMKSIIKPLLRLSKRPQRGISLNRI